MPQLKLTLKVADPEEIPYLDECLARHMALVDCCPHFRIAVDDGCGYCTNDCVCPFVYNIDDEALDAIRWCRHKPKDFNSDDWHVMVVDAMRQLAKEVIEKHGDSAYMREAAIEILDEADKRDVRVQYARSREQPIDIVR